jgi:hypothetical protein
MESDYLRLFYEQEHTRDAVKAYMLALLDERALKDVYDGQDVAGYKEARKTVEKLFSRLEELYGAKDKPITNNKAR